MLSRVKGKPRVYTTHGDGDSCETFAKEITERFGFVASAPQDGDKIVV